jgi:putative ABC transport system substrate-binding protein
VFQLSNVRTLCSGVHVATVRSLAWIEGRNLRIDLRFASAADIDRMHAYAMELVSLDPDVIVTGGTVPARVRVMQQQTRTIPIIFMAGASAEIGGVVRNISRPEGNITGISIQGCRCRD